MDGFDLDNLMEQIQLLAGEWGLKVIGALAVVFIGRIIAGWLRGLTRKGLTRADFDPTLVPFLANLAFIALMTFVLISAAGLVGIPISSFVAVIGAAGLAVALAFQGTLSNFSSGVMLLTFRPFKVGDFVEVGGVSGTVKEIGVFVTTLTTPDNVQIVMPNTAISGDTIKNYSANATRRIDLVMGVGYGDDLNVAISTIREVLSEDSRVLADPAPQVAVSELGDSSVNIVVRPWVNGADYWPTRFDLTKELKERLEAAGCEIPFPQRDVHFFYENAPVEGSKSGPTAA
ncbi:mechanosensitive ion channel domain-containing protein [Gemmatimonadota bacterium DH-20]|uniref:Mechanosensitive ion channel domain-containing protein n=1 Tax=Gaopeijia maritima TaxID=3119007 RepID=A0ABU9E9Q5_9BACT